MIASNQKINISSDDKNNDEKKETIQKDLNKEKEESKNKVLKNVHDIITYTENNTHT